MNQSIRSLAFASALLVCASAAGAQTRGVTDTEILLGTSVDLTGPVASMGAPIRAGFEIAAEIINEAGGIHGRQVRVLVEDNGYDTRRAILAVQKLINSDGVFGIIGLLGTEITKVAMPLTVDEGIPMLFPAAPLKPVYDPPQRLSFGLVTGYDLQLEAATAYAHDELGKRRFCMMYQDDEVGVQSVEGVERKLGEYGLELIERTSFKRGATDFSAQFARMKAAECDAVMLATLVRESSGAALERAKLAWDVALLAPQGAVSNAVIGLAGEASEGLYGFTPSLPVSLVLDDEKVAEAVRRYKERTGQDRNPDDYFLVSLAGMLLFAEGARNAGPDLTVDSFVTGMEQIEDFDVGKGWGRMTFTPEQRIGSTKVFAMQVKDGAWTLIKEMN